MRVTTAFNRILRIPAATVVAVHFGTNDVTAHLRLRSRKLRCECGYVTAAAYDRSVRRWRHLDVGANKMWLQAEIRRLECPTCGVRTEVVPWARPGARQTREFENTVAWLTQRADKSTVARFMRCAWETVDRIVGRVVADHLDDTRLDGLVHLGVDEISYRKGHRYLTVVVDHDTGRVVWIAEGRTTTALLGFYDALGPERRAQIRAVSMDMTSIYRSATEQAVPHAVICLDPFHIMKWVNEALDRVYSATPRADFDREVTGPEWRRTRTALRTGVEHLNDAQRDRIRLVRRNRYQLWRAWDLKEQFRQLYRSVTPANAAAHLKKWCTRALRSRIPAFRFLVQRIRKYFDGVIAAVQWGLSNSRVEGVNAKIRLINNRAHGHRSVPALTASIYLCLGGIDVPLPTQT